MNMIRSVLTKHYMNAWKRSFSLMAPISPFFSDTVFRNLNAVTGRFTVESVHHADFPVADEVVD